MAGRALAPFPGVVRNVRTEVSDLEQRTLPPEPALDSRPGVVVLIAASEEIEVLKAQAGLSPDILVFADSDSLRALDAITRHRPQLVLVARVFTATRRGAVLINGITTDPTLSDCEIRVFSHVAECLDHVSLGLAPAWQPTIPVPGEPLPPNYNGTRQHDRARMGPGLEVRLNGDAVTLVNFSPSGAQVSLPTALRPSQRVSVSMTDREGVLRCAGSVAWVSFEPSRGEDSPRYRAGLRFLDADLGAVEALHARHRAPEWTELRLDSEQRSPDEAEIVGDDLAHSAPRGANAPFRRTEDQGTALDGPSEPLAEAHVAAQTPQVVSGESGTAEKSQAEARRDESLGPDADPGATEALYARHETPESIEVPIDLDNWSLDEAEIVGDDLAHSAARGANAPFPRREGQEAALDGLTKPLAEAHAAAQTPQVVSGEPGKVDKSQTEARRHQPLDRASRPRKLPGGTRAVIENRKPQRVRRRPKKASSPPARQGNQPGRSRLRKKS